MRRSILIGILALFVLSSFATVGTASAYSYVQPFNQSVAVPTFSFVGQNFTVYVNDSYGFTNYTVTAYIAGNNLTGLSPSSSVHTFQANSPDFKFNVKSPLTSQAIYITIISAAQYGSVSVKTSNTYQVTVVDPIVFHAVVLNTGVTTVKNLTVDFYLDNSANPIGNVTVGSIAPNQAVSVNFTYPLDPVKYLGTGEHTLKVSTSSSLISINGKSGASITTFYYGTPPNYNWIYYVAAIVVIFMVFLSLSAGRKPVPGMRAPKWRRQK